MQYREPAPAPETPEDVFTVPYKLEGSRHDRVQEQLLKRQPDTQEGDIVDRSDETFASAQEYQQAFQDIVSGRPYDSQVLVSDFYLYDPTVQWRDETAIELDLARFDPETRTVYCIETTGKNLESVQDADEPAEKKKIVKQEAWEKGLDRINRLQEYMSRFGWRVEGRVAAFYQDGKESAAEVEIYTYTPEVDA